MMKKFITAIAIIGLVFGIASADDQLVITGSTTVLPIAQACAEVFMDSHPSIDITVRGGGSGVGIAALLDATCDIADASRPMKSKELTKARAKGINPVEHIIAWDCIAVIVHPDVPVSELSLEQISDIYTGKINNWKDVGGPRKKIVVVSRDVSSGTYEVFKKKVLGGGSVRDDALKVASNQAVMTSVSSTPFSIGYVGLGYLNNKVKAVKVNGVTPSKKTAKSGAFPIVRPLYMYTNGEPTGLAKQFLNFVFSSEGQKIVDELGYVPVK